jgi:hypothetical protein
VLGLLARRNRVVRCCVIHRLAPYKSPCARNSAFRSASGRAP